MRIGYKLAKIRAYFSHSKKRKKLVLLIKKIEEVEVSSWSIWNSNWMEVVDVINEISHSLVLLPKQIPKQSTSLFALWPVNPLLQIPQLSIVAVPSQTPWQSTVYTIYEWFIVNTVLRQHTG